VTGPALDEARRFFEVVDCPFCGGSAHRPVTGLKCDGPEHNVPEPYRSMSFRMVRCGGCGLVYQRERLRPDALAAFYGDEDYFCYQSFAQRGVLIRLFASFSARALVRLVERWRPRDSSVFVDYGCGNGSWLELFREVGAPWDMYGTEISAANVEHVRRLGFRAHRCDDGELERHFAPGSVGVIFMHHVIEHVPSPLRLFEKFRRVLAPGGIIVGQTPDTGSLECRLFGDYWVQWHLPQHLVLFDQGSLRRHAARAELEVMRLKSSPSGATQWSGSLLKYWAAKRGRVYRWTNESLHPYLTLLCAPVSVVQCLFNNSSHLDFILRKPAA
jgi:SAM-dependent methyltransferase